MKRCPNCNSSLDGMMKRCPNCNGSIVRLGHKEKPFLCTSCNEWFSDEEVTPKQTNGDRIRSMMDEELAEWIYKAEGDPALVIRDQNEWLDWLKWEAD